MENQVNTKYGIPRVKITKVSEGDILRIREEEAQRAFAQQLYLSIIVLHDKFDYEKVDLKKYLSEMLKQYDSMDKKFCSIDDIVETVKEEIGIDLRTI